MRKIICLLGLLTAVRASAQYKVVLEVEGLPANTPADSVYVAGSMNSWNPGVDKYRVSRTPDGPARVTLMLPEGPASFKFTRGSWASVETGSSGADVDNRTIVVRRDTTVRVSIAGWKDRFAPVAKKSTAGSRVHIVSDRFYMPQLNRYRRVWICLPKGYESGRHYPVLYMHDGQNLFEDTTAFSGEWGIDEAMDTLQAKTGGLIIVGIDHGGPKRINEYSPYDMERFGKGEGAAYTDFLVRTLKPFIDSAYRTRKGRADTYVAGSSMGGLISMYAILRYPNVFGGAGIFSPAFWVAPGLKRDVLRWGADVRGRLYFYAGAQESSEMVPDMMGIYQLLRRLSAAPMQTVVRPDGKHNEPTWRQEFPAFVEWVTKKPPVKPMPKF
ncbi:alpha/beta hydrolase [Flaviaesturariibacter flavus]|uniref:Alpha/beta hydrolase n=1 Tax=Flaviaesturariibacter flavus TaxID=2502780 RepID=A0A4R1B8S6_9BACT|nr:alpha/beta hydrolase-fold protein [Flaviaesturariibacter flavus]TCJ12579.1 alpha/beta hydrolase [Flaviaesturariibacter flavus]